MSDWETEDGLPSKFRGEVVDAYFSDEQYGVRLTLVVDTPDMEGDREIWYGTGQKTSLIDEKHCDTSMLKNGRFNSSSGVGVLVNALKADPGLFEWVKAKGQPDNADTFIGLKAVWERKQFGDKLDGEPRMVDVPIELWGDGGDAKPAGPAEGMVRAEGANGPVDVPEWLIQLAEKHDSYDEFMEAALTDSRTDRNVRKLVNDQSLWSF